MLKKILAFVVMLYASLAFAAVDVNKGTAAELDGIKGVGPALSAKILEERKKGNFKDWADLISRVSGIGEKSAAKLSEAGLTVGGASYKAAEKASAKADQKANAKADQKADKKAEAKTDDKATAGASAKK